MPIEIYMSDDDHIVHMDYIDPWSFTDLAATFPQQKRLCDGLTHSVSVIVDLNQTKHIPPGVLRARESPLLKSPQVQHIVAVGGPYLARTLGESVLKIVRYPKARFFATKEEAIHYLRQTFADDSIGGGTLSQ